jgi:hypothetical protein
MMMVTWLWPEGWFDRTFDHAHLSGTPRVEHAALTHLILPHTLCVGSKLQRACSPACLEGCCIAFFCLGAMGTRSQYCQCSRCSSPWVPDY